MEVDKVTDKDKTKPADAGKVQQKQDERARLRAAFRGAEVTRPATQLTDEKPEASATDIIDWERWKKDLVQAYVGLPKDRRPLLRVTQLLKTIVPKYVVEGKTKTKPVYYSEVYRVMQQLVTEGLAEQVYEKDGRKTFYRITA